MNTTPDDSSGPLCDELASLYGLLDMVQEMVPVTGSAMLDIVKHRLHAALTTQVHSPLPEKIKEALEWYQANYPQSKGKADVALLKLEEWEKCLYHNKPDLYADSITESYYKLIEGSMVHELHQPGAFVAKAAGLSVWPAGSKVVRLETLNYWWFQFVKPLMQEHLDRAENLQFLTAWVSNRHQLSESSVKSILVQQAADPGFDATSALNELTDLFEEEQEIAAQLDTITTKPDHDPMVVNFKFGDAVILGTEGPNTVIGSWTNALGTPGDTMMFGTLKNFLSGHHVVNQHPGNLDECKMVTSVDFMHHGSMETVFIGYNPTSGYKPVKALGVMDIIVNSCHEQFGWGGSVTVLHVIHTPSKTHALIRTKDQIHGVKPKVFEVLTQALEVVYGIV